MDDDARRAYAAGFGCGKTLTSTVALLDEVAPGWRDNPSLFDRLRAAYHSERSLIGRVHWAVSRAWWRLRERLRRGRR